MTRRRVDWTPDMDAALRDLRGKGFGFRAAGDVIGVAPDTAQWRVNELGLPVWSRGGGRRPKKGPSRHA